MEKVLRAIDALTRLLAVLAADFGPWLTPIAPCYAVAHSLQMHLSMPPWASWASAASLEFVGIAAINTILTLQSYNLTKRKVDPVAVTWPGLGALLSYLALGVGLTVGLGEHPAVAGFFALAGCSYVVLALRATHAARLATIEATKMQRREQRKATAMATSATRKATVKATIATGKATEQRQRQGKYDALVLQILQEYPEIAPAELAERLNCNRGTAYKVLQRIKGDGHGNGQAVDF